MNKFIFSLLMFLWAAAANAALTIEITEGMDGAQPIAIVPFGYSEAGKPPEDIAQIVRDNLRRSGLFSPMAVRNMVSKPIDESMVAFQDWRMLAMPNIVIGKVIKQGVKYNIQFQLFDVFKREQLIGYSINTEYSQLRQAAHRVSDLIFEKLSGIPGAFNSRIAYVTQEQEGDKIAYTLQVADADGHYPQPVLKSHMPIMSPAWSPDGDKVAYVTFERRNARIYVQELRTGTRNKLASFKGLNGAPAWSPDGRKLALTLSKDGNPEIYVMNVATKQLKRITRHMAIDTEPVWTPDGKYLIYTSDRGGKPQIYQVPAEGGRAKRLTFEGGYNARPRVSPDGKLVAMVHGGGNVFKIAVLDRETGAIQVLTDGPLDESPSFAPNGSMILYASLYNKKGVLAAVSVDGRVRQRLGLQEGEVREPAWSPMNIE